MISHLRFGTLTTLLATLPLLVAVLLTGCGGPNDTPKPTRLTPSPIKNWLGREVTPVPPPANWAIWDSGTGVRVATPVPLHDQTIPNLPPNAKMQMLLVEHKDINYVVLVCVEPLKVTARADVLASLFESVLSKFSLTGGFSRTEQTDRLYVCGYPAVQEKMTDGSRNAITRIIQSGDRSVSLTVSYPVTIADSHPAITGFFDSLEMDKSW